MLAKTSAFAAIAALVSAMLGLGLAAREVIPPQAGLALFAAGGLTGFVALVLTVTMLAVKPNYPLAMIGALGVLPFLGVAGAAASGARFPAINDASTDFEHPPAFIANAKLPENAGRDMAFPPAFAPVIKKAYPELQPLTLPLTPEQAYARAVDIARKSQKWSITHEDEKSLSFEAVANSRVFHFKHDVIVRVTPSGPDASRVDARSKSRLGHADLGANARRIQKYFAALTIKQ